MIIPRGYPIQLIIQKRNVLKLNSGDLDKILLNDKFKDKPVVILSIVGDMRRGKSFMLNFLLRYLQSEDKNNWLGNSDNPLNGFSWKNGKNRDTTGILIWSEPYIISGSNGEEYVILLMDTQGSFDKISNSNDNEMIFALSTMLSSMQIFNINSQIREDNLQFLSIFIEYGQLMMKSENINYPFQHLQFLIRDWNSPYMNPYGMSGGENYLKEFLAYDKSDDPEIISVRKFIKKCFFKLDCFLLPFPGSKVMCHEEFNGKISDIKKIFIDNLKDYVAKIFSESYLVPKIINGQNVICQELIEIFKVYFREFSSNKIYAPRGLFDASVEASNMSAIAICKRLYKVEIDKFCITANRYISENQLQFEHQRIFLETMKSFNLRRRLGNSEQCDKYRLILENELILNYESILKTNRNKKTVNKEILTPIILLIWYLIGYTLRVSLTFVGLTNAGFWINWILFFILLTAIVWSLAYCVDNEIKGNIERIINESWISFLKPIIKFIVKLVIKLQMQNQM